MSNKDKQMTWYDVTLYQFEKLQDLLKIENEEERLFAIAELLLGEEVTNLPISEFVSATKQLSFLSDEIETKSDIKDEIEIAFNNKYMLDALKNSDCDEMLICLNVPLNPIKIMPKTGNSFLFLVLPVRVKPE